MDMRDNDPTAYDNLVTIGLKFRCKQDLNKMPVVGVRGERKCASCAKVVHDLSLLTLAESKALLAKEGPRPCVRYIKIRNGKLLHLEDISRYAGGAAIAAFALVFAIFFLFFPGQYSPIVDAYAVAETQGSGLSGLGCHSGLGFIIPGVVLIFLLCLVGSVSTLAWLGIKRRHLLSRRIFSLCFAIFVAALLGLVSVRFLGTKASAQFSNVGGNI